MQTHYKAISMKNPVSEFAALLLGFIGGGVSILHGPPHIVMSSLVGSGAVALFIACCTYIGTKTGDVLWKMAIKKYKNYKSKSK